MPRGKLKFTERINEIYEMIIFYCDEYKHMDRCKDNIDVDGSILMLCVV